MFKANELREQRQLAALTDWKDPIDIVVDSALADSEAALEAQANVQALMTYGIRHRTFGLLDKDNRARARVSVQHSAEHGPMTVEETETLSQILPHLAKSLQLGQPSVQLRALEAGLIAAIDNLAIGVCVLDAGGRIIHSNSEFRRQVESHAEMSVDAAGRVRLRNGKDQLALDALREGPLAHGKFGARPRKEALGTAQDGVLCVEVAPLGSLAEIGSTPLSGAVLYSVDTSRPSELDPSALRQIYGLTEAEAEVAEQIAAGRTNAEMADQRGRSVATVNSQVKSLLAKTNCANRTQFVRLLLNFSPNVLIRSAS
ncbi:MAG: helix-turn-helix transcriptional regulator [Pseudomonadota bacterium]